MDHLDIIVYYHYSSFDVKNNIRGDIKLWPEPVKYAAAEQLS